MLKRELVEEQRWLSPQRFNRLLAVYQVLPGPEAHEMCVHLGMMRGGRLGGLLAGLGFMLPGLVLILAIAAVYDRLNLADPAVKAVLLGAQIAVLAIIARAVHRIADHVLASRWLVLIAIASGVAALAGTSFWLTLPLAGATYACVVKRKRTVAVLLAAAFIATALFTISWTGEPARSAAVASSPSVAALFLSGLKAGLLTFGGAYTAIPFVRGDAVGRGWITEAQFLDGLALSSVIPAPLIIFATFVGFQAAGLPGALAIAAGIFLPAFALAMLFYDRLETVMEDERLHAFLEGVAAAVVGLIAATLIDLAVSGVRTAPSLPIAAAIAGAALTTLYLWRSKLAVPAVLLAGAGAGYVLF